LNGKYYKQENNSLVLAMFSSKNQGIKNKKIFFLAGLMIFIQNIFKNHTVKPDKFYTDYN